MRARAIKNEATVNTVSVAITPQEAARLRRENQVLKLQLLQAQMDQKVVVGGAEGIGEMARLRCIYVRRRNVHS